MNNIHVKLDIHFSLEGKIVKKNLYLSKLAAQMVTSAPSENLSLHLYEYQNKNFNFDTLKTLILHARSIFFKGGHPTKIWRKKIFFMKTLSKLGALTGTILIPLFSFIKIHVYKYDGELGSHICGVMTGVKCTVLQKSVSLYDP